MTVKLHRDLIAEIERLMEDLAKGNQDDRKKALFKIEGHEKTGKIPVEALIDLCDQGNHNMFNYAVGALGRNGSPPAVKKLLALLKKHETSNVMVLELIVEALGKTAVPQAGDPLLELIGAKFSLRSKILGFFRRKDPENSANQKKMQNFLILPVLRALEVLASPKTAEKAGVFLSHPDGLVRWHTIQILRFAKVRDFNPQLKVMSEKDPVEVVREGASIAFEELSPLSEKMNN